MTSIAPAPAPVDQPSGEPIGPDFFVVGGTMGREEASYVERPADKELLESLLRGEFCYVLTPRQMGKSSLMIRTADRLEKQGVRTTWIDLTGIGKAAITVDEWYLGLLRRIRSDLHLPIDEKDWWQTHAGPSNIVRFLDFLDEVVLGLIPGKVVVFIDEIDSTLELSFRDDFFAAIRRVYNLRAEKPEFKRLTFALLGVAAPADLIKDKTITPFNIGQGIALQEFDEEGSKVLQEGLQSLHPVQGEQVFKRIYYWTGGHPYLTQKLCKAVADEPEMDWSNPEVDRLVERLFLKGEARNKETNLQFVQVRVLDSPQRDHLLATYRKVISGRRVRVDGQSIVQNQLQLCGLVKEQDGVLQVRNRIYRRAFDRAWVRKNTPTRWPAVISVLAVLLALVAMGLLVYDGVVVPARVERWMNEFPAPDQPADRLATLAKVFRTRGLILGRDYDSRAIDKFYALPREEQLALFPGENCEPVQSTDASVTIIELSKTLADVSETGETTPLLAAMQGCLKCLHQYADPCYGMITYWHDGRQENSPDADITQLITVLEKYGIAISYANDLSGGKNFNPALLFERARIVVRLQQLEEQKSGAISKKTDQIPRGYQVALDDLEIIWGMSLQRVAPTAVTSPTLPPEPPRHTPGTALALSTRPPAGTLAVQLTQAARATAETTRLRSTPSRTPTRLASATRASPTASLPTDTPAPTALPTPTPISIASSFRNRDQMQFWVRKLLEDYYPLWLALSQSSRERYPNLFDAGLSTVPTATPRLTSTPTATATFLSGPEMTAIAKDMTLLYSENFDLGRADGWNLESSSAGAWRVEDGQLTGSGHVFAELPGVEWGSGQHSLEFDLGALGVGNGYNVNIQQSDTGRYLVMFHQIGENQLFLSLVKSIRDTRWTQLAVNDNQPFPYVDTVKYHVRIDFGDGQLSVYLHQPGQEGDTSLPVIAAQDPQPLPPGWISFESLEDMPVRVDNVVVYGPPPMTGTPSPPTIAARQRFSPAPKAPLYSVEYSSDGTQILTAGEDGTARIWDAASGQQIGQLDILPEIRVFDAVFSPDNKRVLITGASGAAEIWEADGSAGRMLEGHDGILWAGDFSPDGKQVVTAGADGTARLWDAESGAELLQFLGHTDQVTYAAFSPDGRFVATASWDGTARIWDAGKGEELLRLTGHEGYVNCISFSPDGRQVVTAGNDLTVRVWDAEKGQQLLRLGGYQDYVQSAAFSPDGRYIVSASWDATVRIWEINNLAALELLTNRRLAETQLPPTPQQIPSGSPLYVLTGHTDRVEAAVFSPDGTKVISASQDGTARIWDVSSGQELSMLLVHPVQLWSAEFSPLGYQLAAGGSGWNTYAWDLASEVMMLQLDYHIGSLQDVSYSPDGRQIVTASNDRIAHIWNVATGEHLAELKGHSATVNVAAFSPDGRRVVTASADGTARVWDAQTGLELAYLSHEDRVNDVAFSPDGRWVVSGSNDNTARVWDAASGQEIARMGHDGWVNDVAFSPDGRWVASGSSDNTARIWEAATGVEISHQQHGDQVYGVAFSPDGLIAASASVDGTARIWEVETGQEIARLQHGDTVYTVAFSPDGRYLLTSSADNTASIWDVATGEQLSVLQGHASAVISAAFSPDGSMAVTIDKDGILIVWDLVQPPLATSAPAP